MIRVFEMKNTLVAVPVRCLIWQLSPTRFRASKMTRVVAIMAHQSVFDDDVYRYYTRWRLKLEGETENITSRPDF